MRAPRLGGPEPAASPCRRRGDRHGLHKGRGHVKTGETGAARPQASEHQSSLAPGPGRAPCTFSRRSQLPSSLVPRTRAGTPAPSPEGASCRTGRTGLCLQNREKISLLF